MIIDNDLSGVIASSMCIGCGACEVADKSVAVRLEPKKLIYEPDNAATKDAADVCPAVRVDYAGHQQRLFPGAEAGPYGVVESVYLAQSTDEPRNNQASSGGLIKELLLLLLEREDIDGIIALDHVAGIDFAARLITESHEIDRLPGSIYHNLKQTSALELLRANEGRYVLVAIPCQLEGIYNFVFEREPHLRDRIALTIGLLCGWQYSHHSIEAMAQYLGYDSSQIDHISYRGGGPVGRYQVKTTDGSTYKASRRVDFSYQVAFDRHFNTPRCHVCVNHSNFLADIVVGDAWLPSTVFTKTGISLVICRREDTPELLDELERAGKVVATRVTDDEILESQTARVVYGEFAYAYADHLDELGLHRPQLDGPNKGHGKLRPHAEVEHFHRELVTKQKLMQAQRYRWLKWRKATVEFRRFVGRYVRWFAVRILRVKSLTGRRREIPRERLSSFR